MTSTDQPSPGPDAAGRDRRMLRAAPTVAVLVTLVFMLGASVGALATSGSDSEEVEAAITESLDERFVEAFDGALDERFDEVVDGALDEAFDEAFERELDDALDGSLGRELDDRIEEQAGADDDFLFELGVGDCLDDVLDTGVVDEEDAIPCEEPHDLEVYAALDLPDGEYPGEEVYEQADLECVEEFEIFTAESYEESPLDFLSITPNEEGWEAGDREVICLLYDVAGEKLTGSARGRPT